MVSKPSRGTAHPHRLSSAIVRPPPPPSTRFGRHAQAYWSIPQFSPRAHRRSGRGADSPLCCGLFRLAVAERQGTVQSCGAMSPKTSATGSRKPSGGSGDRSQARGLFGSRAIGHSASIQNAPTSKPRAWRTRGERPWSLPAPSRATMSGSSRWIALSSPRRQWVGLVWRYVTTWTTCGGSFRCWRIGWIVSNDRRSKIWGICPRPGLLQPSPPPAGQNRCRAAAGLSSSV
jgi:hypothetical protein